MTPFLVPQTLGWKCGVGVPGRKIRCRRLPGFRNSPGHRLVMVCDFLRFEVLKGCFGGPLGPGSIHFGTQMIDRPFDGTPRYRPNLLAMKMKEHD